MRMRREIIAPRQKKITASGSQSSKRELIYLPTIGERSLGKLTLSLFEVFKQQSMDLSRLIAQSG